MIFDIRYHELVVLKDISRLPKVIKGRIQDAIEEKLMTEPALFGKPLRRSLKGYWKLRVGDYRVIFRIETNQVIKIFIIQHRSVVYKKISGRIPS
ncbi:MAG: type II toxin-antitoxin system RelE/ParE family toxin [Patescibacteria group bacterium]